MLERIADREEALQRVKDAAVNGDPQLVIDIIYNSYIFDSLIRWLSYTWPDLDHGNIEDIVSAAVEVLYENMRRGQKVRSVIAFLIKVAHRKAYVFNEARKRMEPMAVEDIEKTRNPGEVLHPGLATYDPPSLGEELDHEEKMAIAISRARALLPRLGQENVQKVMSCIFDAFEAGTEDFPNGEIANITGLSLGTVKTSRCRGFQRLAREAAKEGYKLPPLEELGLTSDNDEGEGEDDFVE